MAIQEPKTCKFKDSILQFLLSYSDAKLSDKPHLFNRKLKSLNGGRSG